VGPDLTIAGHPEVFVAGDLAHALNEQGKMLPGVASVAVQQGLYIAGIIRRDAAGVARPAFPHPDKGPLATIGRARAIAGPGPFKMPGRFAWWFWLLVHIYFLNGFRNRLTVMIHWAWSYFTFGRGARLIVGKEWQAYREKAGV